MKFIIKNSSQTKIESIEVSIEQKEASLTEEK